MDRNVLSTLMISVASHLKMEILLFNRECDENFNLTRSDENRIHTNVRNYRSANYFLFILFSTDTNIFFFVSRINKSSTTRECKHTWNTYDEKRQKIDRKWNSNHIRMMWYQCWDKLRKEERRWRRRLENFLTW